MLINDFISNKKTADMYISEVILSLKGQIFHVTELILIKLVLLSEIGCRIHIYLQNMCTCVTKNVMKT